MARSIDGSPHLSLDEYRRRVHIPECAFNGVENPNETLRNCDHVFMQWERDAIAQALTDAENLLAEHLGYYIGQRYVTDYGHEWTDPILLNWGYIVGGGVEGLTEITPSASDFTTDPATITVAQSDFPGGTDEIKIVETSTGLQIHPSDITTSGTDYIISIDQCLLIEWDDLEDQSAVIDYDAAFPAATWLKLSDLTIYRSYRDESDQATVEFAPSCKCIYCGTACAGASYDACVYVLQEPISKVRVQLGDYNASTGTWQCAYPVFYGCYEGDKVTVNYLAGTEPPGWQRAVMALAHTMMPFEPCGCAAFDFILQRDRNIPSVLTAERINCPFGMADGAWYAWRWMTNVLNGTAIML